MTLTSGILVIGAGLGVMAFGLWLFYAFLPLFYGLLGVGVGYWLGLALTGNTPLTAGILESILAIVVGVIFAAAAYWLEPIRRILAGVAVGSSLALSIGYALGAGSLISLVLALGGAIIGGIVVPMVGGGQVLTDDFTGIPSHKPFVGRIVSKAPLFGNVFPEIRALSRKSGAISLSSLQALESISQM